MNTLSGQGTYRWSALCRDEPAVKPSVIWLTPGGQQQVVEPPSDKSSEFHLPKRGGMPQFASGFVDDIQAGFSWLGDWLRADCQAGNDFSGWLQALGACPRRRVLRSSEQYQAWHQRLLLPQYLDGQFSMTRWPGTKEFLPQEIQALECLDLPYFEQDAQPGERESGCLEELVSEHNWLLQSETIRRSLLNAGSRGATPS